MELCDRLRVYLIADYTGRDPTALLQVVQQALAAGVTAVQYRDKDRIDLSERRKRAEPLKRLAREAGTLFIVNDDIELALDIESDGVHLGPRDLDPQVARSIVSPRFIIGGSAGTVERAVQLQASGVDYLGVGAVFEAHETKPDASAPRGPDVIRRIRRHVRIPIVAIGGIQPDNARQVVQAGADGVAVVRAVLQAADPAKAVRDLWAAIRVATDTKE